MSVFPTYDPLLVPATSQDINEKLQELETMPVEALGYLVDCDERSMTLMAHTLKYWDDLPEELGAVEGEGESRTVLWKMGDNTVVHVNKSTLQSIYDETLKQRAIRSAALFSTARKLKELPEIAKRAVVDSSTWNTASQ